MKGKSNMLRIVLLFLLIGFNYSYEDDYDDIYEPQCDLDYDDENDCDKFLSFASTNWHDKDYLGCIEQYKTALYCGCISNEEYYIFKYLGRSFMEIGKLDSAYWSFDQGLKYNGDDENLLEYAAWNAGKMNDIQNQMYYIEQLLEINPDNIKALKRMSDTYKKNEMYEEQLIMLGLWLDIEPNNKKAIAEKKAVYGKLGKDENDINRERWNTDKSNLQYGLDYAQGLIDKDENEVAIDVCKELLAFDANSPRLLKVISDAYVNTYEEKKALQYLEKLGNIDSKNVNTLLEISEVCMNAGEFNKGYDWSNKAISLNKSLGKCFFQRAELLVALVETNMGDDIDFCDRLVYDLAWEDYDASYNNGYLNAKVFRDQLDDFISTKGDWFLNAENNSSISPSNQDCLKLKGSECYSWLERKINSKR
jgi:hypothetical protein